jgi:hypothetical protein
MWVTCRQLQKPSFPHHAVLFESSCQLNTPQRDHAEELSQHFELAFEWPYFQEEGTISPPPRAFS